MLREPLQPATLIFVPAFTRQQRIMLAVVPRLAWMVIRLLGGTWRYRDANAPGVPCGQTIPGPTIFAFWHCAMLPPLHRLRNLGIAILVSRSFDGELIARTVERFGFVAVRGSSSRYSAGALRGMQQAYTDGRICAFTPDGPKGPARIAKPGPVQLAELTGATWLGAFHAQPSSCWRLRSWDGFMIPKPFCTVTFGWPTHVPPHLQALQQAMDEAVHLSSEP
jgi:lysophospholipid acyltransferase (LPLAT)-like uncharacterized protein